MSQTFIKQPEDFSCEHCGERVVGDGYTNHCPRCLWSKHVDENPGDRAAACGGLMPPVGYGARGGGFAVIHTCEKCGRQKSNQLAPNDDLAPLIGL